MSKVVTDSKHYTDIAEAIRGKGVEGSFKPSEMAAAIEEIPSGGIIPSGSIILTEEKSYDVTEKAAAVVDMSATRAALAEAVTAKGVDTLPDSSFDTIANHIGLIEGGGGLPNVRKFTVPTDSTIGTYGGVSFPVVESGKALYILKANAGTIFRPYYCGILSVDHSMQTVGYHNGIRYDNLTNISGAAANISDGVVTILGGNTWQMKESYTLDVYEIIL